MKDKEIVSLVLSRIREFRNEGNITELSNKYNLYKAELDDVFQRFYVYECKKKLPSESVLNFFCFLFTEEEYDEILAYRSTIKVHKSRRDPFAIKKLTPKQKMKRELERKRILAKALELGV